MKHILIASDFSKHADYALQRAVTLAKQHKATLYFIHTLVQPWIGNFSQIPASELEQANREKKKETEDKLLKRIKKYSNGIETHVAVIEGRAADEIVRHAQDNTCELIIAGAHGAYHINDYVLGTTSSAIVSNSSVPVLLIKKEPTFPYKRILVATDFSQTSKYTVEFTFNCFPDATFQLLHVVDIYYRDYFNSRNPDEYLMGDEQDAKKTIVQKMDQFLAGCNVDQSKFEKKIMGGYFADLIVSQSQDWEADLISFGTQGSSQLLYLLLGSVANRLLQLSTTDMLAVPPKKK